MIKKELIHLMTEEKIIAIVRGIPISKISNTVKALRDGGIHFVEITYQQNSPTCIKDTTESINLICNHFNDVYVGAGTVMNESQVEEAYKAGAKYIISPNVSESVIEKTNSLDMVSIPGAYSPTEIVHAYEIGASFVKVFPAGILGAEYIKSIRGPLSNIPLMAVGGVNIENMFNLYNAGYVGFGIGGNLVNKEYIESNDFNKLSELATKYTSIIRKLK